MNEFGNRYKEFLYLIRKTSAELSRDLGYSSASKLNRLEPQHGNNKPSIDILIDIFKTYPNLNERWLLLGEGTIWKPNLDKQVFNLKSGNTTKAGANVVNDSESVYFGATERIKELEKENEHLQKEVESKEKEVLRMEKVIGTLEKTLDRAIK